MSINSVALGDMQGLNELKVTAKTDADKALPEVAKQFEAIFLQAMLKSMRMGGHFIDKDSPFNGENQQTFQAMLDGQYAETISQHKSIGLADFLSKDVSNKYLHNSPTEPNNTDLNNHLLDKNINILPPATINNTSLDVQHESKDETNHIEAFVNQILPYAKEAAKALGLDPKILIAQAALETGWGKSMTKGLNGESSNNYFNIKANGKEPSVKTTTTEYFSENPIKISADFRKYDDIENSFNDYVSLIQNSPRYQHHLAPQMDAETYIKAIHQSGYATDPKYSDKVMSIYRGDDLNQALAKFERVES